MARLDPRLERSGSFGEESSRRVGRSTIAQLG
jgi:hypothetical protein